MSRRISGLRRAGALAVVVAASGAGAIIAGGVHGDSPPVRPKHAVLLDVGNAPTGVRIPSGFVGLSTEYSSLLAYAGRDPRALNPTFLRLIQNLAPGGSPVIRIGGDTTDWSWWPTAGATKPPWARYVLTPRWIAVARAVALATGARLILGINFEADSRELAAAESDALLKGLGRTLIAAFELGNEPEVYGKIGWYTNSTGMSVLGRPPSYGFRAYLADYRRISSALPSGVPLAGPALALTWPLTVANRFLSANPRVRLFTFHFYPLKRCYNPRNSPTSPTLDHLVSARSAGPPLGAQAAVAAAHARGIGVRIDEVNSVSCKGLPGLSDRFVSALWVTDALFRLAQAGIDGVNIHTLPHVSYQPFAFTHSAGRRVARVKPIYYGLLLFTQAAPAGSRLLPTFHASESLLRTWATRGPGKRVRLVLINDSAVRGLTLAIRPPQPASSARLERLTAPGLLATSGVALGGQSYGPATSTGTLSGKRQTSLLQPIQNRYVVKLPPASAALLTLSSY